MKYIVKTWESVEGTYEVEADSEEDARTAFSNTPDIDWDRVDQREYMAFSLEIKTVKEVKA